MSASLNLPTTVPQEEPDDFPVKGIPLGTFGPLNLPAIVYGAGAFSNQYNSDNHLSSDLPIRTIRLALRYGIRAFDTSAYYGPSEVVLGNALHTLKYEFPRSSYQLMTKCGRYGLSNFDYSPTTIRDSVKRSLERLQTDYFDTVYLHDVEFVATPCSPKTTGDHSTALRDDASAYGLAPGDEGKILGEGDQNILNAFHELQKLKAEGLVKNIGITGYPLPTLLRLALLIKHNPPHEPVDILLSYSHLCLQNTTFLQFIPHFYERAQVKQLLAASPLSMGLLTPTPPAWHPAPAQMKAAAEAARASWDADFPNLAVGYSMRLLNALPAPLPLVIGFSNPREVHEAISIWRNVVGAKEPTLRQEGETRAKNIFREAGYLDWSWASP